MKSGVTAIVPLPSTWRSTTSSPNAASVATNQSAICSKRGHHNAISSGKSAYPAKAARPSVKKPRERGGVKRPARTLAHEALQNVVHDVAALARIGKLRQRLEGTEVQHALGVDRIRVADQRLDARGR